MKKTKQIKETLGCNSVIEEAEPRAEETGAQGRRRRVRKSHRETEGEEDRERRIRAGNRFFRQPLDSASADMPNFAGTWKMKKSENFDELLKALGKPSPVSFPPLLPSLHSQLHIPA